MTRHTHCSAVCWLFTCYGCDYLHGAKYENGEWKRSDESRTRRDEQRRKDIKMDKRAKDKLVRSPRENGGG